MRRTLLLESLLCLLAVSPLLSRDLHAQKPDPERNEGVAFRVVERRGDRVFVQAARAGVSAYIALKDLESLGAFKLNLQLPGIRQQLKNETLSLFFQKKDAVAVAELLAVACGLDLEEDREEPLPGQILGKRILTIVTVPLPETDAGRRNLRKWALDWYERYLRALATDPSASLDKESQVRVDMALLALAQGQLLEAVGHFQAFLDKAGKHPFANEARLKLAECELELKNYDEAIKQSKKLFENQAETSIGMRAALVYARAHLALSDYRWRQAKALQTQLPKSRAGEPDRARGLDDLVAMLELYLSGFRSQEEFPDLLLLLAEAHRRRGRPDRVIEKIRQLESIVEPIDLPNEQWATVNFLEGGALVETGKPLEGEKKLLQFIGISKGDPRTGLAWLSLAKAERDMEDPLQGLFCARLALQYEGDLLPPESHEAKVLANKMLLDLGKFDAAIFGLEVLLQGPVPDKELLVFTAQKLLEGGRPERAKSILEGREKMSGPAGDRARLLIIKAESEQNHHQKVIETARALAGRIVDARIQAEVTELVGDAYMALGRKKEAAEAYGGRIR